jgi:uncharacterized damage-inducible protein DinB
MTDHLRRLIDHLAWADERALEALRAASPEAADDGRTLLAHILGAEHVWLARLEGRAASVAVWPMLSLDQCAELARENRAALRAYVARLTPADLARRVAYRNSAGHAFEDPIEDILLHVAMHGSYHRGQIAASLRAGGAVPQPTDYIAFIRGAPTATRADAARAASASAPER